jgi:hypothetical protein
MVVWQCGQVSAIGLSVSAFATSAPHQGQCFIPVKMVAKQDGQATVASDP